MASPREEDSDDTDLEEVCDVKEKMTPATMKRNLDTELTRKELLEILVAMEGELQAKEIAFAALKAETDGSLKKFRYGCFFSLDRDSLLVSDDGGCSKSAMDSMYTRQLALVDSLIKTQHKAQHKTRMQLAALERQYHKVCADLEQERQKGKAGHAAEADSVKSLQEEKIQLQRELDEEHGRNVELENDLRHLGELLSAAKAESNRHRQGAVILAKERRWFSDKISKMAAMIERLEEALEEERAKSVHLSAQYSQLSLLNEQHEKELSAAQEEYRKSLEEKNQQIQELFAEIKRLKSSLQDLHRHGNASVMSPGGELVSTSVSVTLPFPLNPAADTAYSTDSLKSDTISVTLVLQPDTSSSVRMSPSPAKLTSLTDLQALPKPAMSTTSTMPYSSHASVTSLLSAVDKVPSRLIGGQPRHGAVTVGVNRSALGGQHSRIPQFLGAPRTLLSPLRGNSASMLNADARILDGWHTPSSSATNSVQSLSKADDAGAVSNFDIFDAEMANLQQLLVSMAAGETENIEQIPEPGGSHSSIVIQSRDGHLSPSSSAIASEALQSSIHTAILAMDHSSLARILATHRPNLNEPICNGVLALHVATESGCEECVRVLLEHGVDPNLIRDDHCTPLHVASMEGHLRCLQVLLEYGGCVSVTDLTGSTPLHYAASNGHSDCCRVLLDHGARIDAVTSANWTPLHSCIHSGHSNCLEAILTHQRSYPGHSGDHILDTLVEDVVNMVDKDGWTVAHLATVRESKDCLEVLSRHIHLDLERRDKWNRSVLDVASVACRQFLQEIVLQASLPTEDELSSRQEVACIVSVELTPPVTSETKASPKQPSGFEQSCVTVGSVVVSKGMTWMELEEKLGSVFLNHTSEVSIGLRTKKTSRLEQDSPDAPNPFTLGISLSSVKYYSVARYHWSPGTSTEKSPFEMLAGFNTNTITIRLFGLDDGCQESLAYETLIPVSVLQNYLRLIEQYRSVVFYGPKGTGKTFLVKKLAKCIQMSESRHGNTSEVTFFTLSAVFSRKDLLKLLFDKGCLISSSSPCPPSLAPILILDDLAKISVVEVFKDILPSMEIRGPANQIIVRLDGSQEPMLCYMNPNCYIIGTMDRARSTGLELSIQQRFKWVHLRCDQEPIKYLLHRHLLRRLAHSYRGCIPLPDNSIYKAAEWVICVWQRLNEGLSRLGILDLVFGPCYFLVCPIEANKPKAILRWLNIHWNQVIAPTITEAVIRGSGGDIGGSGQKKVTSTALYVLMQRAVVAGCPLSGSEKEKYFSGFQGSNELDIKIRGEKRDQKTYNIPVTALVDSSVQRTARNMHENFAQDHSENSIAPTFRTVIFPAEDGTRTATMRKGDVDIPVRVAVTKEFQVPYSNSSLFAVSGIPTRPSLGHLPPGDSSLPLGASGKSLSMAERRSPLPTPVSGSNSVYIASSPAGSYSRSFASYPTADANPVASVGSLPSRNPVIISQPVRSVAPTPVRTAGDLGTFSKRPVGSNLQDEAGSSQEHERVHASPIGNHQWRRAMSPGPEILHTRDMKVEEMAARSGSPGPDLLPNRLWRADAVHGAFGGNRSNAIRFPLATTQQSVAMTLGSERRIDFRVVNPTKVLPIDVAAMATRDSSK